MKLINFFSIEKDSGRGKQREKDSKKETAKPVQFFGLSPEEGESARPPVAVHSNVKHADAVNFFEISDVGSDSEATEEDLVKAEDAGSSSADDASEVSEEEKAETDPTKEASSKIVVVEDDNIVSTMLKHLLERRGFSIEIASDGRRASEIIDSEDPPALVILDVMLPFVDGFELIRKIRANSSWSAVPVVMLTAKTRETDIVRALETGADDYIVKPFQPQELIARVKRFVKN